MADSMWDRVKDFGKARWYATVNTVYKHGPAPLHDWIERRALDQQATEEYALYEKRKAAGFYDEPAPKSPIKEWVQEKRQELEARGDRVELAHRAIDTAARDGIADAETERLIDRMQSTASPSYAEYQRDLANGVKLETAWDAHERRVIAEPGVADSIANRDAFAQEFTDRRTNKEYRVEATYLGKTGHAIEVRDVETENVLYSGKTKDQNPLGALDEGRQWLRDNVLKPSAAQHDLELFRDTQSGKAWPQSHEQRLITDRGWVALGLEQAANARRNGDLEGARHFVETARQDRIPYQSPDRGLSR